MYKTALMINSYTYLYLSVQFNYCINVNSIHLSTPNLTFR